MFGIERSGARPRPGHIRAAAEHEGPLHMAPELGLHVEATVQQ
jgi:hypothetical protein